MSKLNTTFAMEIPKPNIKFNGGRPVALCNRCFCMMCYVSCAKKDLDEEGNCVVIERRGIGETDYISTPIGQVPPPYCDTCKDLLFNYSLNE